MDAITLAGSFATMVGLLVSFQSIRDEANINDFLEWLRENNNENTAMIIENDIELQRQLSVFISQNHDEVMKQLSKLNSLMVSVASRMDGLSGLASTFELNNGLSAQAIDVLRQFVNSNSKNMYRCETTDALSSNDFSYGITRQAVAFIDSLKKDM